MGLEPTTFCMATGPWTRPAIRSNPMAKQTGRLANESPRVRKWAYLREVSLVPGTSA